MAVIKKETDKSMKYYNFIVNVQLYLHAVVFALYAWTHLQGMFFGYGKASKLYEQYPALKSVELIMAAVAILSMLFCIFTRMQMYYFKKRGPLCFYLVLGISGFYHVLYDAMASYVTKAVMLTQQDLGSMVSTAFIIVICNIYLRNRAELFTE